MPMFDKMHKLLFPEVPLAPVIDYGISGIQSKIRKFFIFFFPPLRRKYLKLITNERIVEFPFVFRNIADLKRDAKILDFGCTGSNLSLELASLGYQVVGIDLRDYKFFHPNFKFVKGDFLRIKFSDNYFDCVIAVSTIEHIGLDVYGGSIYEGGDKKIVNKIWRVLKVGGKFIITLPFGKIGQTQGYRVYDGKSLSMLLKDFEVIKKEYYMAEIDRRYWFSTKKEELMHIDSVTRGYPRGVACITCCKTKR